jgi:hypothetical protein
MQSVAISLSVEKGSLVATLYEIDDEGGEYVMSRASLPLSQISAAISLKPAAPQDGRDEK